MSIGGGMMLFQCASSLFYWWGKDFCPKVKGKPYDTPNTEQMIPTKVYKPHTFITWMRRILHSMQGYIEVVLKNKVKNQGLWEVGIASRGWVPSGSRGGFDWLGWLIFQVGRALNPQLSNKQQLCLFPLIRRIVVLGDLIYGSRIGKQICLTIWNPTDFTRYSSST